MTVVPLGYVTVLEAADLLLPVMYAGEADSAPVINLRKKALMREMGKRRAARLRKSGMRSIEAR